MIFQSICSSYLHILFIYNHYDLVKSFALKYMSHLLDTVHKFKRLKEQHKLNIKKLIVYIFFSFQIPFFAKPLSYMNEFYLTLYFIWDWLQHIHSSPKKFKFYSVQRLVAIMILDWVNGKYYFYRFCSYL